MKFLRRRITPRAAIIRSRGNLDGDYREGNRDQRKRWKSPGDFSRLTTPCLEMRYEISARALHLFPTHSRPTEMYFLSSASICNKKEFTSRDKHFPQPPRDYNTRENQYYSTENGHVGPFVIFIVLRKK